MTAKASYKVVILFEDEVRIAAKAVAALAALPEDTSDEDFQAAARTVLEATHAALQSADDESAILMLARKPAP